MVHFLHLLSITATPWLNALITMSGFLFVGILINVIIDRVLKRLARFTKTELDDKIISAIHIPLFISILLIGIINVIQILITETKFIQNFNGLIYTLLVLTWMVILIRISNILISNSISRISSTTGLSKDVIPHLSNFIKVGIFFTALGCIFSIWSINLTPLLASAGIISAIVALAARDTIANFFGGISIFIDKPYKIGDYIDLDSRERGEVIDIGIRSTRITTRDDVQISIPNSIIANSKIINESAPIPNFRVRIPFSVAYGTDVDLLEKTLLELSKENTNILTHPEPRVRLRKFGDSGLEYELLCWAIDPSQRGLTIHELGTAIYKKFQELKIIIPFPQRVVHVRGENKLPEG